MVRLNMKLNSNLEPSNTTQTNTVLMQHPKTAVSPRVFYQATHSVESSRSRPSSPTRGFSSPSHNNQMMMAKSSLRNTPVKQLVREKSFSKYLSSEHAANTAPTVYLQMVQPIVPLVRYNDSAKKSF